VSVCVCVGVWVCLFVHTSVQRASASEREPVHACVGVCGCAYVCVCPCVRAHVC